MPRLARIALFCLLGSMAVTSTGCNMVPRQHLAHSQMRARQLYDQNRALAMERDSQAQSAQGLAAENQRLQQQIADTRATTDTMQSRLDNLMSERAKLQSSLVSMKASPTNPMSDDITRKFEELARKYPQFEFDPQTGVSKFQSDIVFESGSAEIKADNDGLLRDFARILNSGDAQALNILVVGHTDDRRVAKPATRAKHPDNWHLSAHRAITVTHALSRHGLKENRMGVAGYGPYQPLVANKTDAARKSNRRVEIFVLAPNAANSYDGHAFRDFGPGPTLALTSN